MLFHVEVGKFSHSDSTEWMSTRRKKKRRVNGDEKKSEQKNVHDSTMALDVIVIIDRYRNKHVFILPHSSPASRHSELRAR